MRKAFQGTIAPLALRWALHMLTRTLLSTRQQASHAYQKSRRPLQPRRQDLGTRIKSDNMQDCAASSLPFYSRMEVCCVRTSNDCSSLILIGTAGLVDLWLMQCLCRVPPQCRQPCSDCSAGSSVALQGMSAANGSLLILSQPRRRGFAHQENLGEGMAMHTQQSRPLVCFAGLTRSTTLRQQQLSCSHFRAQSAFGSSSSSYLGQSLHVEG